MSHLPERMFLNPVWHALQGPHRSLLVDGGLAARYPADVAPFAALREPTRAALERLAGLLEPGEAVWIVEGGEPRVPELNLEGTLECLQMALPPETPLPTAPQAEPATVVPLGAEHAQEMVALTEVAFPGFFRPSTYRMGSYFGVRASDGRLIAMAGERLRLQGHPEMSGICTHPAHRGRGLARRLIAHLAAFQSRQGLVSWLHVGAANSTAIALYHSLGFCTVRSVLLNRVSRAS